MNAGQTPSKRSWIEKEMNVQVFANLFLLCAMCLVCCVGSPLWESGWVERGPVWLDWTYLGEDVAWGMLGFSIFWLGLINFQNVVPISLYLTVEIVKTLQAYFIFTDLDMYYEPIDAPCLPRSWNLADDLGQIEYIFSDKTGTLTRNIMEFKKFSVCGVVYGEGFGEPVRGWGDEKVGEEEQHKEEGGEEDGGEERTDVVVAREGVGTVRFKSAGGASQESIPMPVSVDQVVATSTGSNRGSIVKPSLPSLADIAKSLPNLAA
ncbi:hypothetical protein HK104_007681, partial [Borealophlyctis nickersoniae]